MFKKPCHVIKRVPGTPRPPGVLTNGILNKEEEINNYHLLMIYFMMALFAWQNVSQAGCRMNLSVNRHGTVRCEMTILIMIIMIMTIMVIIIMVLIIMVLIIMVLIILIMIIMVLFFLIMNIMIITMVLTIWWLPWWHWQQREMESLWWINHYSNYNDHIYNYNKHYNYRVDWEQIEIKTLG